MIKVSILYPHNEGSSFNMDYYLKNHIPMVQKKLGAACKQVAVEQGISGGQPGTKPAFSVTAHMLFDSTEAFETAFGPHSAEILADIPNYTRIQPIIQIGEVKM